MALHAFFVIFVLPRDNHSAFGDPSMKLRIKHLVRNTCTGQFVGGVDGEEIKIFISGKIYLNIFDN